MTYCQLLTANCSLINMSLSNIVLVTGGAGFIGSHIAATLRDSGAKVRIIDNLVTGHIENLEEIGGDIDFIQASVSDEDVVRRALEDVEVVFHEAALPSVPRSVADPKETHIACIDGTFNLLQAARERNIRRFIYAASSSAYGDQPILPKHEDMRPDPLSPYAVAKLVGEYYCQVFYRVYGLETMSLRYFNVFGPRQDPSSQYSGVISRFISSLMSDERPIIYGDGEQTRDFTYIENVVAANLSAVETTKGIGETMNVANGEKVSLNELLIILKKLTGKEDAEADYKEPRAGDVKHSQADNTRAKECLDYKTLVSLEDGLKLTMDWWKQSRFAK